METQEIAKKLADYCKHADWDGAHKELYAQDAISIEPFETPDFSKETKGMAAIKSKGEKFSRSVEKYHQIDVSAPLVAGNSIAFTLTMDMSIKGKGRMKSPELCVYEVKDGKIVLEQFLCKRDGNRKVEWCRLHVRPCNRNQHFDTGANSIAVTVL